MEPEIFLIIPARQIGTADAAFEQRIARNHLLLRRQEERNAAGRVSGRVQDMGFDTAGAQDVAFARRFVDARVFGRRDAQPRRLHAQVIRQKGVAFVHIRRVRR